MMNSTTQKNNPMARVMSIRDFRLLFAGSAISLLGDQFVLIATPWLVLKLTGDPLVLGIVLALEGIPRAVFMLLGGAVTDRLSPRLVMLLSDLARMVLTALMAYAVFTDSVQIWMLYAFGLGFGLVAGFAIPAQTSIVPMLVKDDDLQAGNSIMMGVAQLLGFVGPTVAGILIGRYASSLVGIGLAFAVDAVSFAVSAACLWLIRGVRRPQPGQGPAQAESVWASILSGIRYLWSNSGLRLMFVVNASVTFLLMGPLLVGIPVLASQRLPEGAVAYGLLMSAYAGGSLAGYLLAGALPRPSGAMMSRYVVLLLVGFGVVIGSLGLIRSTWIDFSLLLLLGLANGYFAITLISWLQARTPKDMLGRMMSILMFSGTGLAPVSQAIAGAVSKVDLTLLFLLGGGLTVLLALWTAFQPGLIALSESLAAADPERDPNSPAVQS